MAVKAMGRISHFYLDGPDLIRITVDIEAGGMGIQNVEVGVFDTKLLASGINPQLAAFIQQYATDKMGVTFDLGDTVRLVDGIALV